MRTPSGRDEGGRTQARAPPGHNPLPTPHQFSRTVTPGVAQWGGDVTVPGSDSSPFTARGSRACRSPAPLLTTSWPHPGHPSCLVDSRQSCSPGARPPSPPSPPGGVVPVLRARWPCPRSHCPDLTAMLSVLGSKDTRNPDRGVPGIRTPLSISLPSVTDSPPRRAGPGGMTQSPKQRILLSSECEGLERQHLGGRRGRRTTCKGSPVTREARHYRTRAPT